MLKPPIDEMLKKVDSRYTLVLVASKRAREIIEGEESLTEIDSIKPVTIATNEIYSDKIAYRKLEQHEIEEQEALDRLADKQAALENSAENKPGE